MKIKTTAALFLTISLFLGGCGNPKVDPDKYSSYVCYDYHLACLDAYSSSADTKVEYENDNYYISYRKPVGVSDDQFVCASVQVALMFDYPKPYVLQNPDTYVDVWQDWTVKEIEIYYYNASKGIPIWQEKEPARTPTKVITTITDELAFLELAEFITNDAYSGKYEIPYGYACEIYNEEEEYELYLRVHFNESENIVWDTQVFSCISEGSHDRYIAVDKGRSLDGFASRGTHTVAINDFGGITSLISAAIDSLLDS